MKNKNILIASFVILAFLFAGIWYSGKTNKRDNNYQRLEYNGGTSPITYRYPGDFEKQQAIWLQWPSEVYENGSRPVSPAMTNILKTLAGFVRVNLLTRNINEIMLIKEKLKNSGYTGTNVHYYNISHYSIWARDVGPVFIKNSLNKLSVADFKFNNYGRDGNTEYINTETQIDRLVAEKLKLPVVTTKLVSEGGGIESNGAGTLMVTESVVLSRNPGLTRQQIESEYKRVLGVKKIIWLKKGLAEDDRITGGHVNEIARFSSTNTILLAQVLPENRYKNWASTESYLRMEENYKILLASKDQDGKPFNIVRVPLPPNYGDKDASGKIPIRSYLNYAASNGVILMQTYWKTGRAYSIKQMDDRVKSILMNAFPGRSVIGIDTESINLWGGGLHCITQHMPS